MIKVKTRYRIYSIPKKTADHMPDSQTNGEVYAESECEAATHPIDERAIDFIAKDGKRIHSIGSGRERYRYIDNYLNEHPDAEEIHLPYSADEIRGCMYGYRASLSCIFDCMLFLDPFNTLHMLDYDRQGLTLEQVKQIHSRMTGEERRVVRGCQPVMPGTEDDVVSMIPALIDSSLDLVAALSSPYPSYHLSMLVLIERWEEAIDCLIDLEWKPEWEDEERGILSLPVSSSTTESVRKKVLLAIEVYIFKYTVTNETRNKLCAVLGRVGMKCDELKNKFMTPVTPYGIVIQLDKRHMKEIAMQMLHYQWFCPRAISEIVASCCS